MAYQQALEQLEEMVRKAKTVPLSSSVVIAREDALALIGTLKTSIPDEHAKAKEVLADRDGVLRQAREEAERIVAEARAERERLLSRTELVKAAEARASQTIADAEAASTKLKVEADDYADAKLASFEILLSKTLRAVTRGRETLRQRLEAHQDEVEPLNLEDSGEFTHADLQMPNPASHHMP